MYESIFEAIDYTEQFKEDMHRYDCMRIELGKEEFLKECVVLSEGVDIVNRINFIHEAAADKKASFWQKFKTFFTKIWSHFLERVDGLLKKDTAYLTKYKNIILGKKMKEFDYNIPDYNTAIQRLNEKNNLILPDLQFIQKLEERVKQDYTGGKGNNNNAANFDQWTADIQKFVTNNKITASGEQNFADACKAYYSGGEAKATPASKLNMQDMYNFCISKDTLIKNLKAQTDSFNKWMNQAESNYNKAYKQMANDLKKEQAKPNEAQTSTSSVVQKAKDEANAATQAQPSVSNTPNQPAQQGGNGVTRESMVYSAVYESYIVVNEAGVERTGGGQSSSSGNKSYNSPKNTAANAASHEAGARSLNQNDTARDNVNKANANNAEAAKNATKANANQAQNTAARNYVATKNENGDNEAAIKEWTGLVTMYVKKVTETSSTVLGAMCTAAEKIGRDYMSIIRQHVQDYLGDVNKSDDNAGALNTGAQSAGADMSGTQNVTGGGNTPGL